MSDFQYNYTHVSIYLCIIYIYTYYMDLSKWLDKIVSSGIFLAIASKLSAAEIQIYPTQPVHRRLVHQRAKADLCHAPQVLCGRRGMCPATRSGALHQPRSETGGWC